jgi:alpha-methylacyl-CoA racemase
MEGSDVCFAPVLEIDEAPGYPANAARKVFVEVEGVVQPAPAPRFSVTPGAIQGPPPKIGSDAVGSLRDWGLGDDRVAELQSKGVI